MSQTRDNFTENLKEVWEPAYAEFLNNSDRTRAQFDKTSRGIVQGKYVKASSHIGRNAGFAFLAEGATTPTAGQQTFMNELVTLKKSIGRIKLSSEVIQDSASDAAAVADAMSVEKEGLGRDARREMNFLLHAAGNGVIAQLDTSAATTTINLNAATPNSVVRYLRDVVAAGGADTGLRVDIGTVAAPTAIASNREVQSVNAGGTAIVISGANVTTSSSHFIFRAGQGGADGGVGQKVVTSLPQIIDDTAVLYGADPATYPLWAASVLDAQNGAVTESAFEEAFDLLDIATGDTFGDSALVITTHSVRRQYVAQLQGRVRYAPVELKGGFKSTLTIEAGGGPVGLLVDRDCTDNTAYLVDPSSIVRVVGEEWNFVEESGSPIQYNMDDDSYHLLMRSRMEYLCKNRRRNARIDNLGAAE